MSIILTSGKRSAQKLREGARKDKNKGARPKSSMPPSAPPNSYMPSPNTVVWNDVVDGTSVSIALRKDNMEVWCNDSPVEVNSQFKDDGSYIDFTILSRKARIEVTQLPDKSGVDRILTIEGRVVPQTKAT